MAQALPISREQFIEWKGSQATLWFLENLFLTREYLKEGLAEMNQGTEQERMIVVGRCQAIKDVLDSVKYNTYFTEDPQDVESSSS